MRYVRTFWGDWNTFHAIADGRAVTLCGIKCVRLYADRPDDRQWATISGSPEEAAFYKGGSHLCTRCARKAGQEGAAK